jgi:hypothetical protein
MWSSAGDVVVGIGLVVTGWVTASSRVLPAPSWFWGARDVITGAPLPSVRASGIGSIALGGFYLATAWLWLAGPDDSATATAALALSLCFLCCTVAFNQWAVRLRRADRR